MIDPATATDLSARVDVTPGPRHEVEWTAAIEALPRVRPDCLGLASGDVVLMVVAHPDDETFSAGATIASLTQLGVEVHVLTLTSGEAALAHVGIEIERLAERRQREFAASCSILGAEGVALDLPDSRLTARGDDVDRAVCRAVGEHRPDQIFTVWWRDPHPDHEAAGRAALRAAKLRGCPVRGFGVWAQHWSDPASTLKEGNFYVIDNDAAALAARAAAVAAYESQTLPVHDSLSPILPDWFVGASSELGTRG